RSSGNRSPQFARKLLAHRSAPLRPVSLARKFPRCVSVSRSVLGPCLGRFTDPHGGNFRPACMAPFEKMPGQCFSRALVVAQNIIEMAMVKTIIDIALERCQLMIITDKTVLVQLWRGKLDFHDIVVAVQPRALMIGWQAGQLMRGGKVKFLSDTKHQTFLRATASRQKSGSS